MIAPRVRGALLLFVAALAACKSGTEPVVPPAGSVTVVAPLATQGYGIQAAVPFAVQVLTASGAPIQGATVNFRATSGPATVAPASATTDANGHAETSVSLGAGSGIVQITATVAGSTVAITGAPIMALNTNADSPCSNAQVHAGRVVAASNKAIVVADTGNPTPSFSPDQYLSVGTTFDTLVDAVDRGAFGDPTDIDKNGRVLIFFTSAVNQLTPASANGVVGGFFYERDLFPRTTTAQAQACPTSNVGEMFYMLVPDPNGTINGNKRDTSYVRQLTIGTVAHEYQHLINAGRRMYVNNASAFEEVWLNEGLSHVAEELLYYRVAGHAPRQNIDAPTIRASTSQVNIFNEYQNNNFGRFRQFLTKDTISSPYADNDSLETRGATWNLLRYLADHRSGTSDDADTWKSLVNSTTTGLANLTNIFGANTMDQIRDWATSVGTDDFGSVSDTRFLQPSWNLRSVFVDGYQKGVGPYPLHVTSLADGVTSSATLVAGGEWYYRFGTTSTNASVDWQPSGNGTVSSGACQQGTAATTIAVGQVISPVAGTGICIAGATGAQYTLVAFYESPTQSANTSVDVIAHGTTLLATPTLVPSAGALFSTSLRSPGLNAVRSPAGAGDVGVIFENRLRQRSREALTPLIPLARAWARSDPGFRMPADRSLAPMSANFNVALPSQVQITIVRTQ